MYVDVYIGSEHRSLYLLRNHLLINVAHYSILQKILLYYMS